MQESGQSNTSLAKAVSNLQGNIEFMNQINNAYHYVQIPLRMSNQNTHGDLFVYTNKSGVDRPACGGTAQGQSAMAKLNTKMGIGMKTLTDKSTRNLAEMLSEGSSQGVMDCIKSQKDYPDAAPGSKRLMQRLQEKGYSCTVQVENQSRKKNLVEDFMQQEHPSVGILHRYSFDMRA